MSDEETRTGGTDETSSGNAGSGTADLQQEDAAQDEAGGTSAGNPDAPAEASPAGDVAAGVVMQGEVTQKDATDGDGASHQKAAFAATVLGDTLPSAVRSALAAGAAHGHGGAHGGSGHGHDAHDDEHFAHALPMTILGGVLVALVVLTVLTVAVTSVDLGSQGNFIVAMIIATIKAGLVMGYFMHLVWDSKFNVFAFLSSFLFVLLFLSMALLDRGEYQSGIDTFEADQKATAK